MTSTAQLTPDLTADAFAERLFSSTLATVECLSVYVGDRLGWYESLAADGPATPADLAGRTGTCERYAREWLEQQAVYGILLTDPTDPERRYELPPGVREVLTDEHSLLYLGPLPRMFAAAGAHLPNLLDAYRTGGGVSWQELGADARESQAAINRPWFERSLADALHGVADIDEVLRRPGARIADVGCGAGWSTLALARAYPEARVDGIDVDAPSVEMARGNAESESAELAARVTFRLADGATLAADDEYDAAFAFECLHDMPRPVEVLGAVRRAVRPDGLVVIMDEAVADEFTAPGDDLERFMYGASLLICLPDGMSSRPSAETGTVMRRATLERYAAQAGFKHVSVLPIEGFSFFRFYRLQH